MKKLDTNYDRLLASVIENAQLVKLGNYNPSDYESLDDALSSDNPVVKAIAMLIISGNKSETQIYNEISNYLINNL
ncbi:MAG: hypothetical protein ACOYJF_02075 [Prevotella sp.]|jgi:hypothetical protein